MLSRIIKFGYVIETLAGDKIPYGVEVNGVQKAFNYDNRLIAFLETENGIWAVLALLFSAIIGYLLGSLNFAVIISKIFYHDDVRKYGSGNAGATNMVRTYGKGAGVATFICDGLKAAVAVAIATFLMGEGGAYIAALFALLGHIFPVYYKFRGGKGVVVAAISILCLNPIVFLILVLIFLAIVGTSKYISLGSIICAFFYPMILSAFNSSKGFISTTISVLFAVIVIVMHRGNIKRLMARTENKIGQKAKKQ